MLKNYIKLALRTLWKNKIFSLINIIGLSLGLAACIIILLFVQYEKSFDSFHTKNIYRLNEILTWEGMVQPQTVPLSMYPMGPALKNDFPEIKNVTHFRVEPNASLKYKEQRIFLKEALLADSNFFNLFNFNLAKGNTKEALRNPRSLVLSSASAEELFGTEDPIGKMVSNRSSDSIPFTVTGVISVPKNSHLQFDALYSMSTFIQPDETTNWMANSMVTYLELNPHTTSSSLEKKFPTFLKKYQITKGYELILQPLSEIHGGSADITHDLNNFQKFNSSYSNLFFIIALIVLLIGCVNFINLSTAKSFSRAREVGVRKAIGALRSQLAGQFLVESVVLSLVALIFAIVFVKLALPYVNQLSAHDLEFSIFSNPLLLLKVIGGTFVVGIISGIYPALILSSLNAIKSLKGTIAGNPKSLSRNFLIVGQFASAAFLISVTVFILRQLDFIQKRDHGFKKDQVVMIPGAFNSWKNLKEELLKSNLVKGVTGSTQELGNNLAETGIRFYGDGPAKELATSHLLVDPDFLNLYEIKLLAGKNFTQEGNGKEFILNQTLAKELLKDNPKASFEALLGKRLLLDKDTAATVVGVCKDFNFNSLHHKIETLCLYNKRRYGFSNISVKIDGSRTEESLAYIEATWKKIMPGLPYKYEFLDDHFASLYETDKKVSSVVSLLAGLAIIIACLGLLGLASYSAQRRIKEIGIRKVLGSSVSEIVALLSKDFVRLVLLANVIALPLGWFIVSKWLEDFAYRINVSAWIFALSALATLLIALLTVASQALKAATTNPAKTLRTE